MDVGCTEPTFRPSDYRYEPHLKCPEKNLRNDAELSRAEPDFKRHETVKIDEHLNRKETELKDHFTQICPRRVHLSLEGSARFTAEYPTS